MYHAGGMTSCKITNTNNNCWGVGDFSPGSPCFLSVTEKVKLDMQVPRICGATSSVISSRRQVF